MPPREIRDFSSPLLQAPINRLFIPRPIPEFIPSQDRDVPERKGQHFSAAAPYMDALKAAVKASENDQTITVPIEVIKKRKVIYEATFDEVHFLTFSPFPGF